jgi:HPt (histidine-containing phosphotransfer) domain-containing protein
MAFEFASFEMALASAVGDDPALLAELHAALIASARQHVDLMSRARCDANWHMAAHRLKGLAASFGARALIVAADFALESAPGDPVALRGVQAEVERMAV